MSLGYYLRLALRQWTRMPQLTSTAVLTLALGIGGAATMYTVLHAIARLGEPSVPRADEVGRLFTGTRYEIDARAPARLDDCRRWERARSVRALAIYAQRTGLLSTAEGGEEIAVLAVSPSWFSLLESSPLVGRFFGPQEVQASAGRLALVGERAWRSRFGSDRMIVGRTLELDAQAYTVVGVASEPLGLASPSVELYVPFVDVDGRAPVRALLRRDARVSWGELRSELDAMGISAPGELRQIRVVPILDDARYRTRVGGLMLVGPALLVLLIACGNVASLLLVRAVQREREMATRLALGASRAQLAAQLLVEGWTLAAAAGALGAALAGAALRGVQVLLPATLDLRLGVDAATLAFLAGAVLLTPVVFGTAPLLHGVRMDVAGALRAGLRRPLFGLRQYHLRDLLAILEVGLSVGLVTFTFMLLSLFAATRQIPFGFDAEGLIVAELREPQPSSATAGPHDPSDLPLQLARQLSALPGVTQVTVGELPYAGLATRVGRTGDCADVAATEVGADGEYFATFRLPILRGRGIDERDLAGTAPVAVVGEALAARLWPGLDPLGQLVRVGREGRSEPLTVIGIAADAVRLGRLQQVMSADVDRMRYVLYRPRAQVAARAIATVAMRAQLGPGLLLEPVKTAVQRLDARLRVRRLVALGRTLDLMAEKADKGGTTFIAGVQLGLSALALVLAVVGVFGVMRQVVDERRSEFGVRLALGAPPASLVRSVVADGLIRVGIGSVAAVFVVTGLARLTFAGLVSVSGADPRLWLAVLAAVALTATAACYLPSRHAARVNPAEVLRCE